MLIGIPLCTLGVQAGGRSTEPLKVKFLTSHLNYWGSILVALGWVAVIMLLVRSGMLQWLQHGLASVGRMALSNYLLQSILCTLIFYGHGLGQFGTWDRTEQMLLVGGLTGQRSTKWLSTFRFDRPNGCGAR